MADGTVFPAFLQLRYRRDNSAGSAFLSDVERIGAEGKRKFAATFDGIDQAVEDAFRGASAEAKRQLDQMLSTTRNAFGSLNIGAAQAREAANASQARAVAARELAAATAAAAREQGDFSQQTRLAIAATDALAKEQEQAAAAARSHAAALEQVQERLNRQASATNQVIGATRQTIVANDNVTTGLNAQRAASLQAGQQLNDIAISLYSGQRASVVFAQQLPQLAFAFTHLEGKAGAAARVISGPLGAALLAGTVVLGPLIAKMFGMGDASDKTGSAIGKLKDRIDLAQNTLSALTGVVDEFNNKTERTEAVTLKAALAVEKLARATLAKVKAQLADLQSQPLVTLGGDPENDPIARQAGISDVEARLKRLQQDVRNAERAIVDIERKGLLDPVEGLRQAADRRLQVLEEEQKKGKISREKYARDTLAIEQKLARDIEALQRAKREADRAPSLSTDFISPLTGPITGRFNEQRPGHKHAGIDIAARTGTEVRAPQVGVVEAVGFSATLGKYVVISHGGGTTTRYGHLSDNTVVREKQQVAQGDVIGRVGSTGRSTGPHLHYEVRVNGKAVDPSGGKFPIDEVKVVESAEKARLALQEFGTGAAEQIAKINGQFDEQPRLIDQAAAATRKLDQLLDNLGARNDKGQFDGLISDAMRAQDVITGALLDPFRALAQESDRRLRIQSLLARGHEAEAAALQTIWQIEDKLGSEEEIRARIGELITAGRKEEAAALQTLIAQYPALKAEVVARARAEQAATEALRKSQEMASHYLDATRSIRQEITGIFEGKSPDFGSIFRKLNAEVLTQQLFGSMFDDLDRWVRQNTGLGRATDEFTRSTSKAGSAADTLADALAAAAQRVEGIAAGRAGVAAPSFSANDNGNGLWGGALTLGTSIAAAVAAIAPTGAAGSLNDGGEIVVTANRPLATRATGDTVAGMSPTIYFSQFGKTFGSILGTQLEQVLGAKLGPVFGSIAGGGLAGYAVGGIPGAALGALKELPGLPKELSKTLGKAFEGAATGSMVAGIGKSLGIKMSSTGAQIGGAIGSALPIPGGDIIGAIAGGVIGKLIGGTKRGSATIGGLDGALGIVGTRGNSSSFKQAASTGADSIIASIDRIAQALGGTVDPSRGSVSIGLRDGKYRVDTTGSGITKTSKGAIDFGKDGAEAAIRAATLDLVNDGVLVGLRQGTQRLLKEAKDLDKGLADAVDFQSIFDRLKAIKDPVGAALEGVDREFSRLQGIATKAGEGLVELEELYGIERKKALEEANKQVIGSLLSFRDSLTIGDSSISLRERFANAQSAYQPLAARLQAGDRTAYDDFTGASQSLLDISRQLHGSQQEYFTLRDQILGLTNSTIGRETSLADAAASRDSPFRTSAVPGVDNSNVVSAIDAQTKATNDNLAIIASGVDATNRNLGAVLEQLRANGTTGGPAFNFPSFF